jgi:hypothetical protein
MTNEVLRAISATPRILRVGFLKNDEFRHVKPQKSHSAEKIANLATFESTKVGVLTSLTKLISLNAIHA